MTCGSPSMSTLLPRRKRCFGKSVTMRHFSSPRIPCGASTWATTRNSGGPLTLDDVEVDSGAFARGGGFDEGAEAADDSALAADDFADVFFVDFELVDGGVAILDLLDLERRRRGERVVVAQVFDERAVARRGRFGDHNAVRRLFLGAGAAQSDLQQVSSISSVRRSLREWREYKSDPLAEHTFYT